jgi:phosphatidylethanolamine-binding protein (PEBP) family uncharacterized protein
MRQRPKAISGAALLSVLTLAGCGSSSTSGTAAGAAKVAQVIFKSAVINPTPTSARPIPSRYTCDGKNTSPPLEWGAVPTGTGELVLFVLGLTPVPSTNNVSISVEWALAGINPALHRLGPGQLPQGAHLGLTTNGKRNYSICPKHGQSKRYQFELYGLPEGDAVPLNFNGLRVLSTLALSAHSSLTSAHGSFGTSYKRS